MPSYSRCFLQPVCDLIILPSNFRVVSAFADKIIKTVGRSC